MIPVDREASIVRIDPDTDLQFDQGRICASLSEQRRMCGWHFCRMMVPPEVFQREPSGAVVTPNVNRVTMTLSMSQAGYEQLGSAGLCDKTISKLREELIHGPRCTPEDG
jgi:hypothetical protein